MCQSGHGPIPSGNLQASIARPDSLVGESISIAAASAFEQTMSLHFAQIVAKLIESICVLGDAESPQKDL